MINFSDVIDGLSYQVEQEEGFKRQFKVSVNDLKYQLVKDDFDEWHTVNSQHLDQPLPVQAIGSAIENYASKNSIDL